MPKDNSMMSARKEPKENSPTSVALMVEDIVGSKWSMRLLELVAEGCSRPGILLRACSGLSAKVMNERLRKMVRFGIMQRNVVGEKPPLEVQYQLTPFGNRFKKLIEEVCQLQEAVNKGTPS
jgi:DNA-binding HxlR family transcriptional regulator